MRRFGGMISTGGGGAAPTVSWTPGDSNDPITIAMHLDMPLVGVNIAKTMGMSFANPSNAAVYNSHGCGCHLSGTALGAPFWQSVGTYASPSANTTSIVVPAPSGIQVGDLLLAFVGQITLSAGAVPNFTPPSGWASVVKVNVAGAATRPTGQCFWIKATSTEVAASTFTFTSDVSSSPATGEVHRVNGTHATTPINASNTATLLATALVPDPVSPSVTTTEVNCLVFAWLFHDHLALTQTHTAPTSHAELTDFEGIGTGAAQRTASTADARVFAAAGATGTATHDCTETVATDAVMIRVAIAPGTVVLAS